MYFVRKPSLFLFVFLIIFCFDRYNRWVNFNKDNFPLVHDVDQFYCYLPAKFIHNDLTFKYPNNYWTVTAPNGNKIARTTYGMAVMYSPFFFIGHYYAGWKGYVQDGYSLPYKWCLHIGTLLYSLLGLWFCRKTMIKFFSEFVSMLTLLAIYLGTNLFYYTFGWGEMSHSYLFFVLAAAVFFYFKWDETKRSKFLYGFFALAGFAVLIRPTDFVILLLPLLYKVKALVDIKANVVVYLSNKKQLLFSVLIFVTPWLFQLLYWKIYSGSWFIFTYNPGERFFFADPQIINFLFSFRKGWFIYTPVMFLLLAGIPLLFKTSKNLAWFVLVYFIANIYMLSCWWDWGFGGSFGCRAIVQHYAVFAIPLASFFAFLIEKIKINASVNYLAKALSVILVIAFVKLNYDQSWQYKYALIHPSGMTKEAYFFVLNKEKFTPEELNCFKLLIKEPDYNQMINGNRD